MIDLLKLIWFAGFCAILSLVLVIPGLFCISFVYSSVNLCCTGLANTIFKNELDSPPSYSFVEKDNHLIYATEGTMEKTEYGEIKQMGNLEKKGKDKKFIPKQRTVDPISAFSNYDGNGIGYYNKKKSKMQKFQERFRMEFGFDPLSDEDELETGMLLENNLHDFGNLDEVLDIEAEPGIELFDDKSKNNQNASILSDLHQSSSKRTK